MHVDERPRVALLAARSPSTSKEDEKINSLPLTSTGSMDRRRQSELCNSTLQVSAVAETSQPRWLSPSPSRESSGQVFKRKKWLHDAFYEDMGRPKCRYCRAQIVSKNTSTRKKHLLNSRKCRWVRACECTSGATLAFFVVAEVRGASSLVLGGIIVYEGLLCYFFLF